MADNKRLGEVGARLKPGVRVKIKDDSESAILRQHAIGRLWYVEFDSAKDCHFLRTVVSTINAEDKDPDDG